MKKMRKFLYLGVLLSVITAGSVITSCEIGMGSAIDTEPPVFTINYPPTSSVVRGSFILAGTCTDDLENDHVEINIRNVDTGMQWGPYTASVNDNKWTLELNQAGSYNGFEYPDGQYVFTGVGVDKSGRSSGSTSASFYIDNTAPVLILSKPMAIGNETPSKFGKSVNLIGDLADDHDIVKLNLHYRQYKIDEETGDKIWIDPSEKVLSVSGFNGMSSDNPLVIAKYFSDAEINEQTDQIQKSIMKSQRDNYIKIYGDGADNTSPDNKYFYSTFELEDEAKQYRNPGDNGTGNGNITTKYYINSDEFYEKITKSLELSAFSIKKIINGTSKENVNGNSPADVMSKLNNYALESSVVSNTSSVFILNPDNSPNYSITGYKLNTTDAESSKFKSYSKDQDKLSLSIVAGKDNANVKPTSIGVYLYHLKDDDETLSAVKQRYETTDSDAAKLIRYELVAPGDYTDSPNTSLNYTIELQTIIDQKKTANPEYSSLWKAGDFYILEVTGKDENTVELTSDFSTGYGFQAYVNAEAPKITFKTDTDKYFSEAEIKAGVDIEVEIEIDKSFSDNNELYDESKADDLKNRLTIKQARTDKTDTGVNIDSDGFDTSKIIVTKPSTAEQDDTNKKKYTLKVNIGGSDSIPETKGKYKYTFYLSYKDKNAKTTTESFVFYVDNKAPEINVSSVGPTVSKKSDTKSYVNGDLLITGYVQDNNKISNVTISKYEIGKDDLSNYDLKNITPDTTTKPVNGPYYTLSETIDTTKILDEDGIIIKVEAEDSVGNKATVYQSPLYIVDQNTDKPEINGNNFSEVSIKSNAKVTDGIAVNIFDENATLIGSITDDDGIKSAILQIKKEDGNDLETPVNEDLLLKASQTEGAKSITFSGISVPKKAGYYQLLITVKDIGYATAETNFQKYHISEYGEKASDYVENTPKVVWFAVDNEDPEFTETAIDTTETQYKKDSIIFKGTIKDDWKLAETPIIVKVNGKAVSNPTINIDSSKNPLEWSYTHIFSTDDDGEYKFELIATDATGKTSKIERTVLKDTKIPEFKTNPYTDPSAVNGFYNVNTLTIKGSVSDSGNNNTKGSGVDKVTISIDGGTAEDVIVASDGSYSYIYNISDTEKTKSSIQLTVYDKSGNSAQKSFDLNFDFKKPTLVLGKIDDEAYVSGKTKRTNARNEIILQGTVNDDIPAGKTESDVSGIDRILISANNSTFKDENQDEAYTLKVKASSITDGKWSVTLTKEILGELNDKNTIYARVVDKAGNYSDYTLFTLSKDAEKPTVKFDDLITAKNGSDDVYVNGTIEVSGNSNDAGGLASVDLCYYVDADETWKPLYSVPNNLNKNNWKVTIDTNNTFGNIPDGAVVYICAIVSDEAGNRTLDTTGANGVEDNTVIKNFGTEAAPDYHRIPTLAPSEITNSDSIIKIIVDQDTDRPIIKFNNIDLSGMTTDKSTTATWLLNTTKLIGLVSDDDGEVTYLGYRDTAPTFDSNGNTSDTFTPISLSSGSWELSLSDGAHSIWFKVTDKKGTTFYSCSNITSEGAPKSPKLNSGDVYFGDRDATGAVDEQTKKYSSILNYKVDQTAPSVTDVIYYSHNKTKTENGGYETDALTNLKFGGDHQKFKIEFAASDANGIDSVYVYQDTNENGKWNVGEPKTAGTVGTYDSTSQKYPCVVSDYDISELRENASGLEKFVLAVKDNAGLESETTFQINIDNVAPGITVESHNNNAQIRKEFILSGNTSDSDIGTKIKYIINGSSTEPSESDWASAGVIKGSVQSWYLYVDGDINSEDGYEHTKHHKDMFVELYGSKTASNTQYGIIRQPAGDKLIVKKTSDDDTTGAAGERYTTIQPFYVHLQVTDSYGNSSTMTRILNVDPQGDMPIVEMLSPSVDSYKDSTGKIHYKYGWYCDTADEKWIYTDDPGTSLTSTKVENGKTYTYRGAVTTLSGIIRAQGISEGENGIYGLYMQIDPAYDPKNGFNVTGWNGTGDLPALYNETTGTAGKAENLLKKYKEEYKTSTKTTELKGLYIGDNPSWNFPINQTGELNGSGGSNQLIAIRLYAVDKKGNISTTNPLNDLIVIVDSAKPTIGSSVPFSLFRWVKADGTAVFATQAEAGANAIYETKEYQNDMWVTGKWWLKGSVEDENGISEILFGNVANAEANPTTNIISQSTSKTWGEDPNKTNGFVITQPVGNDTQDAYGKLIYKIIAKDLDKKADGTDDSKSTEKVFTINYDNKAPTLEEKGGENYSFNEKIVNDNGVYKVTSGATEESGESGFARAVVYFKRNQIGSDSEFIFDTYNKRDDSSTFTASSANRIKTGDTNVKFEDGLYWKTNTVTGITGRNITVTADANIHKGGLVKFGGSYYTITAGDGTSTQLTLDSNPPADLVNKQILFAIGNVIDHKGTETSGKSPITADEGFGYFEPTKDNTDDFMVEKVSTVGTKTVWSGSINSMNMTDGPVEVHYVVFDQAGNYFYNFASANAAIYKVEGIVSNNAPRLASVRVVSPYTNEDKTKYYSEIWRKINNESVMKSREVTSNLIVAEKVAVENEDGSTDDQLYGIPTSATAKNGKAFITAKNDVTIYPEIVGGNGDLYYSYMWGKKGDFTASGVYDSTKREFNYTKFAGTTGRNNTSIGSGHYDYIDSTVDDSGYYVKDDNNSGYIKGHKGAGATEADEANALYSINITMAQLTSLGNSSIDDPTWFEFTIWDSTPGTTKFTDSLNAKIQLAMNVHVADADVPKVAVNPFYWKGLNDNSIYGSSDTAKVKKQSDLKGHIEISPTTKMQDQTTYDASGNATTTKLGADPKVSGQITITGHAYDDIQLKELYVSFDGLLSETKVATYTRTKQNDGSYVGTWTVETVAKDFDTNHWSFSVKDEATDKDGYFSGNGHKANWEFNIDTSYIKSSDVVVAADVDKVFTIKAKDNKDKSSVTTLATSNTDDSVYNKATYQMDVVPYITHVKTSLSSKMANNPTVYDRTALGKYPVYFGETVTVEGFNLAEGSADITGQTPTKGKWSVIVNGIPTLNNLNDNNIDSNKQPNKKNNDILTDDVEFDVWQFNNKAAMATAGKVNNPVMKISPTGMIGFAFSNGSERFSMGGTVGGTEYSYRKWNMSFDYMKHNEFAYDSEGHTYGTTVGGDIADSEGVADLFSFMSDRWGVVTRTNKNKTSEDDPYCNNQGNNHIKLDSIGQYADANKNTVLRDKNRYQSPSIATLRNGKTANNQKGTYVYLSYYDKILNKICFKAGNLLDTNTTGSNFDSFHDNGGGTTTKATSEAWSYLVPGNAGAYTAVGVTSDNVVVLIWYDGADLQCMYNKTPQTFTDNVIKTGWVGPTQLLTGAGEYCKLVVDSDNNVHIAAYDSSKNDLKYVYIPYDATNKVPNVAGKKTATVDSLNDLGENITIDVAKSGNYQIPYIGYWGSYPALPRVASLADPNEFYTGSETNGTVRDKYTGVWECSIVPTPSTAVQNTVNVGVWKTAGALSASNGGTNKWNDSTADGTSGKCYGNGTSNPVLGYLVSPSSSEQYIETAQKL